MELASLLEELYNPAEIRDIFERVRAANKVTAYERSLRAEIGSILERTPAQRPAYLRKMAKEVPDAHRPAFTLLLAILAQVRVTKILNLRDQFRGVLSPGDGNRRTCAGLYDFGMEIANLSRDPSFPYEVFEAYGSTAFAADDHA